MRDRLKELYYEAKCKYMENKMGNKNIGSEADFIIDNLIENGVIVPPCKVGDWIYVVDICAGRIIEKRVSEIRLTDWNEIYIHSGGFGYPASSFGKTVFFTKK